MRNNIDFSSTNYVQVGATNKNCLKVLPAVSKKTQEFVVGDHTGTLSIFEFNKGEISVDSKTATPAKEISRIELVGSNYLAREKIYYSAGTFIRGFTRKGKETYKVDTYLTETIKSFAVEENRMWTAGEYFLNEYDAGKDNVADRSSLLCPDKINDLFIHHITSPSSYNAILACQDKGIRVVDEGNIAYSFMAQGAVNCINPFSDTAKFPQTKDQLDKTLLFGLSDGTFINVNFEPERPVFLWSAGQEEKRKAGISIMKVFDFQGKGINDIIVVRDDSTIDLFSLNSDQQYESQYSTTLYEGVTGIDAGQISIPGVNEFIISSYSGKISGYLDSEEVNKIESKKPKENPKDTEKKIKALRAEIDKLKQDVDKLKGETTAESAVSTATNSFKVNHKIVRNSHDASYSVHIESQYPIEVVIIQSMVTIELIEVDTNVAIMSLASEDPEQGYALAGTYRFIDTNVLKFELKLRTVEGQYGDLNCFVIPHANPKTCQAFSVPLKPLSLHERYLAAVDTSKLHVNKLRISGEFKKHEIHSWIAAALPDFPPNIDDDEAVLSYRSSFVGTFLVITYGKGKAVFESESISAISILKDVISQEASTRGVHINIQWDTDDQSIKRVLELLKPKFDYYQSITRKYQVLTALKEISNQEGNANFLSKDSREILEGADEITNAFKQQPRKLQYLKGIVTDLYADRAKSKGVGNVSGKISQLVPLLNNFNIEPLVQFFMNN